MTVLSKNELKVNKWNVAECEQQHLRNIIMFSKPKIKKKHFVEFPFQTRKSIRHDDVFEGKKIEK